MPDNLPIDKAPVSTALIPKVLIVNDDAPTLLALSSLLTGMPDGPEYQVIAVHSGKEALRAVLEHNFAVILLDISMPIMDGFETAEAIHSHPRSASTPIIFITAHYGDDLNRLKGYQKGAADYLFAPVIPTVLQAKVAVFVELSQKSLELEQKTLALETLNNDLRVLRLQDLERVNTALEKQIIERRLAEQRAINLASRDALTGLFNRRSLVDQLKRAIARAARREEQFALMFLDLDKFKEINDTFGHETGDELLIKFAQHLNSAVRESDTVARLGGDEFVILLEGLLDPAPVEKVAKKITSINSQPQIINACPVTTSTSIGICFYPQDGDTAEVLLKNADAAMYHAKQSERGTIQRFIATPDYNKHQRNLDEEDMLRALERSEFELFYQPKFDMFSEKVTGVEALLYWHHPRLGLLKHTEFAMKAAQRGLSLKIGEWMILAACAQARLWRDTKVAFTVPISMNVEIAQLRPELSKIISAALAAHGVDPSCLQLEVTESILVRDAIHIASVINEISNSGVGIVIDGFGAEFSSIAALKNLSISLLKIDPCFLHAPQNGDAWNSSLAVFPQDTSLVSAMLSMARAFDLRVVAEGVETREQLEALKILGCHEYQGNYFSKPLQAAMLIEQLRQKNAY